MRVIRADVRPGFTPVDNEAEDANLSCRALGLLTRWLRYPPGSEVDNIPDLVKKRKQRGKTRIEGRDALYKASYELEAEGFIVRELVTNERHQHEWVARLYPVPVPPDQRSDPQDRKRPRGEPGGSPVTELQESAPTCSDTENPQVAPITDSQESGSQESGTQEPSYTQRSNSLPSLSPSDLPAVAEAATDEREKIHDRNPGPAEQAADAYAEALGGPVTAAARTRLAEGARKLLADGIPPESLPRIAADMARKGRGRWLDLATHADRNPHLITTTTPKPRASRPDACPNHPDLSTAGGGCPRCPTDRKPAAPGSFRERLAALQGTA